MKQAMRVVNLIEAAGLRNAVGITLLLLVSALAVKAQSSLTDGHTPAGMAAGSAAGSYALSGFDNVNLFNGKLNLQLPLLQMGGRGGAHTAVTLPFEAQWQITVQPVCTGCNPLEYAYNAPWYSALIGYGPGFMEGRYSVSDEQLNCGPSISAELPAYTLSRITFVTSDGAEYELRDQQTDGRPALVPVADCTNSNPSGYSRGRVFRTADGSAATFISDTDIVDSLSYLSGNTLRFFPSGTLILRDGTRYSISSGLITRITDRNGNMVSFTYDNENDPSPSASHPLIRITDSLNRRVDIIYADSSHSDVRITFRGANGASRTIHVWFSYMDQALRPGFSITTYHNLFPELNNVDTTPYNPFVFSAVELPDGRRYQFKYNQYGEVARVELPTGGAFEYDYAGSAVTDGNGIYSMIYRRLIERRVYTDSSANSPWLERTTYTLGSAPPNTVAVVSHYGPNGSTGTLLGSERHYFYGFPLQAMDERPLFYSAWNSGKEYQTESYNENGTLLRKVVQSWQQRAAMSWSSPNNPPGEPPNDPRIADTTTTLEPAGPNLVSKQILGYDDLVPYNNTNDVKEYDYGNGTPGALLRQTHTTFITASNYTDAATGAHLRSLPSQVSIYASGGTERARTTYEYDNYGNADIYHAAIVTYPRAGFSELPISGLDPAFNSSSSNLTRGNLTATTQYFLNGSGAVTGSISNYAQYDIAGNVVKNIDGLGYATRVDFADRFGVPDADARANAGSSELNNAGQYSYAFPTLVTNALGQTIYTQYDFYLGRLVDMEDLNGVVTSAYSEFDLLDRPTKVISDANQSASIRSQTTFVYDDANHLITTASDQVSFNDPNPIKSQIVYDGLGRTIESRSYENNTQYIAVQQIPFVLQPDPDTGALVAARQLSNPFRPYLSEQPIWTTTFSDALGRVTKIRTPDNAVNATTYSGNTTTGTDQAGKVRRSIADGLGRLSRVDEPDAAGSLGAVTAPAQPTSYTYDALNNLIKVAQGAQSRFFSYDSLSRLIRVRNPEQNVNTPPLDLSDPLTSNSQWCMAYTYDANGNLKTRTDARNVVTTYDYDGLNRPTSRIYTTPQGLPVTPSVNYYYDNALGLPVGAPSFSPGASIGKLVAMLYGGNSSTTGSYSGYDAVGRPIVSLQKTDTQVYQMDYGYDLAGKMISETYPGTPGSNRRVVKTEYDGAGRIAGIRNGANGPYYGGAAPTDSLNRIAYSSHGAASKIKLGNGLWEHTDFNLRLQPSQIGLGTAGSGAGSTSVLGLDHTYGVMAGAVLDTTKNNGNLESETISAGGLILKQSYTYDQLNRLAQATEKAGATQQWQQSYDYDRWGNRAVNQSSTLVPNPQLTPQLLTDFNTSNNRIQKAGFGYDFGGNLKEDPITGPSPSNGMSYDGENKQVSYTKNGMTTQYLYDGNGSRIKKLDVSANRATVFVYDVAGRLTAEYQTDPVPPPPGGGGTSYLTPDHLGSTRVVTTAGPSPTVKARYDYLPFGEQIPSTIGNRGSVAGYVPNDGTRQKFAGEERDDESGLDFMQARYCSSPAGRFTSCDPYTAVVDAKKEDLIKYLSQPQNWNRYVYARNNPLMYVDPSGEDVTVYYNTPDPNADSVTNHGHILLYVRNDKTGVSAYFDYYAETDVNKKDYTVLDAAEPDRLERAAALTIQTTPEQEQAMLDAIKEMQESPPNYTYSKVAFVLEFLVGDESTCVSNSCKILDKGGIVARGRDWDGTDLVPQTPSQLWQALYEKYNKAAIVYGPFIGNEAADLNSGRDNPKNGHEYGRPNRNAFKIDKNATPKKAMFFQDGKRVRTPKLPKS